MRSCVFWFEIHDILYGTTVASIISQCRLPRLPWFMYSSSWTCSAFGAGGILWMVVCEDFSAVKWCKYSYKYSYKYLQQGFRVAQRYAVPETPTFSRQGPAFLNFQERHQPTYDSNKLYWNQPTILNNSSSRTTGRCLDILSTAVAATSIIQTPLIMCATIRLPMIGLNS